MATRWSVVALLVGFGVTAFAGSGVRQPVTGDEVIVLSVSETFTNHGRLGAPIFAGVARAEDHYFISLPLIHVLHWPVFRLLDAGETEARAVSLALVLGLAAVLCNVVGRRGNGAAAVTVVVLLLFWRSDLIGAGWGLPLHTSARSARYDGALLALLGFTFASLLRWYDSPSRAHGLLLGGLAGASLLTHFLGVIAPAMILLGWIGGGVTRPSVRQLGWVGAGLAIVTSPYLAFLATNWSDAAAQFAVVHASRAEATASVVHNVLAEPRRYAHLLRPRSPGPVLWLLALPTAGVWVSRNWRAQEHSSVARLAAANFAAAFILLAALEPTKAPLYALPLLVPVSITAAMAAAAAYRRSGRGSRLLLTCALLAVGLEGAAAMAVDWRAASGRRTYRDVAEAMAAALPGGTTGTGPTRWWWSLRGSGYVPFVTLIYRSRLAPGENLERLREALVAARVGYLVRTPEFDADVLRAGPLVVEWVDRIKRECGRPVLRLDDSTYGPLEVHLLDRPCAPLSVR